MICAQVACRREAAGAGAVANAMGRGAYADALDVTYRSKHYGPGQQLYLPRDALSEDDVVLVVDDFLASGSCQEAMFRIQILEQRLDRHTDLSLQKYAEMDARLRNDPRLRMLSTG